eukprot:gnl/Chilomastix_caulleri/424.p1 GENE.gnl/Chilomastix_caulleri/424~~gnl/Chilomastix_caulleri/424.p1  ORF type:complete len:290 (+),score=94.10 gnl/Chilomastix_caulleri/424:87-956(+)
MNRFTQDMLCGGISGAIARTVTSPLDVVKIILQCQRGPNPKYTGTFDAFSKILAEQGVKGFWKGNNLALMRIIPYSAVKFAAFEKYKPYFADKTGRLNNVSRLVAGALAGITAVAATYPLDVLRTRFAVQDSKNPKYTGVFQAFKKIIDEEGFGALYAGFNTTILGVIPYEGGQFMMHGYLNKLWSEKMARPMNTVEKLLIGCLSGGFAQSISYPVDTVRKAMQVAPPGTYSGMFDCAIKIVQHEGVSGLFKGITMNLVKVVPFSALSFYCFGEANALFNKLLAQKKKQ